MAFDQTTIGELCGEMARAKEHYLLIRNRAHHVVMNNLADLPRSNTKNVSEIEPTERLNPLTPIQQSKLKSYRQKDDVPTAHRVYFPHQKLAAETFTAHDFQVHLKFHPWPEMSKRILKSVLDGLDVSTGEYIFKNDPDPERAKNSYIQLDSVGFDGITRPALPPGDAKDVARTWQGFSCTNDRVTARQQAFGKIGFVCEPTPLSLAIIHLTMNPHFDMDEIYAGLVDPAIPTTAVMDGCFELDHRKQRSFVFTLKYHTLVGDDRHPMDWQMSESITTENRVPISPCCSSIALSLSGSPMVTKNIDHFRNSGRSVRAGICSIFNPFAPWRLLSLHFCPDWKTTLDVKGSLVDEKYVNGPEAFLSYLLTDLQDATVRLGDVVKRIEAFVIPPPEAMFDGDMRDLLLFEDDDFTYSRRYFWAYSALDTLRNDANKIIETLQTNFTDDVWSGEHQFIWPGSKDHSAQYADWRDRMEVFRKSFERELRSLDNVSEECEALKKEIRTLRDQLFSGTSVLESRKNVELSAVTILQGHNIKLLTLVSIFFLPATFVGTVFGMRNMPTDGSFRSFAITMVLVCGSFYVLIGFLNTTAGMEFWYDKWDRFLAWCTYTTPTLHQATIQGTRNTVSVAGPEYFELPIVLRRDSDTVSTILRRPEPILGSD